MDPIRFGASPLGSIGIAKGAGAAKGIESDASVDFLGALKDALDRVNASQQKATELQKQFQLGQEDVSLEDTVIAMQKASVSFQALVQVRNRLISAYHDIMNMPV